MEMISCLIGFTLLFSSIYMSLMKKDSDHFIAFYELLNDQQKDIYHGIIYERMMIYIVGMVLGLVTGFYYYRTNKNDKYIFCKCLMIIYSIKLGFYYVYPKQPLMLYSLTTKQQTDAWADIYTEMKQRWIKSLVVGFVAYLFLGFAVCKK